MKSDVVFTLDGETVSCPVGFTLAAALFRLDQPATRITARDQVPRSVFCGMGLCFDCALEVDGRSGVRACMTLAAPGMEVRRQLGHSRLGSNE